MDTHIEVQKLHIDRILSYYWFILPILPNVVLLLLLTGPPWTCFGFTRLFGICWCRLATVFFFFLLFANFFPWSDPQFVFYSTVSGTPFVENTVSPCLMRRALKKRRWEQEWNLMWMALGEKIKLHPALTCGSQSRRDNDIENEISCGWCWIFQLGSDKIKIWPPVMIRNEEDNKILCGCGYGG